MGLVVCPSCGEENPDRFRLCGFCGTPLAAVLPAREERRTVTIVFSDLQGSTRLGEALDPESVREVMTRYFDAMSAVLRRHGGTLEKFIGDAIMAVFGVPRLHEDDALRAVRAAHEMVATLEQLNLALERVYGIRLTNRTGVNTGEVVVGDATTGQRLATGDTVNTAARLEQAAPPNAVLIGDLTYRLVRDAVRVEVVEPLELKGKAERVAAYRLLDVAMTGEGFARREDTPMIGRHDELAALRSAYESALADRRARLATVIGDAGVGKSRLIREFVGSLPRDAVVVRGRCLPYGEGITFWPLAEGLRDTARIEADDPPEVASQKIEALTDAEVARRLGSVTGFTSEVFGIDEIFWATRRWLEELSGGCPVVWVVDDIHWAEPTFLDLLTHLVGAIREQPVLLLCSARQTLLDEQPEWAADADAIRLVLEPLDRDATGAIVTNLLGGVVPPQVLEAVARASEGNPLFAEQLVAMLAETGMIRRTERGWQATTDLTGLRVPPTIEALLAARLDLLIAEERAVIEPAAVIGLEFAESAVTEMAPEAVRGRVGDLLHAIVRKQLVRSGSAVGSEAGSYRFRHILIRDAAYERLLKRARAVLHEAFVAWADRVNEERDRTAEYEEILGYHLEQAHRYLAELGPLDEHGVDLGRRASRRLLAAGERAMARGDMPAAESLLSRATATLAAGAPERSPIQLQLAEARMELGRFAEADEVLAEAEARADAIGDAGTAVAARLLRLAVELYTASGEHWAARVEGEVARALTIFEPAGDHAGQALAWRLRFGVHGTAGRFGAAAEAAERVIGEARLAGDRRLEHRGAVGYAQSAVYGPTPVAEAIERCEELVERAADDRRTRALVGASLAELYAMRGEFDRARGVHAESRRTLDEIGAALLAASGSIALAQIELLGGELPRAETELRRDFDLLDAMGERFLQASITGLLARVLAEQGRWDEADDVSRRAESLSTEDDVHAQTVWRTARALVASARGDHATATRLAEEAVTMRASAGMPVLEAAALVDLMRVHLARGDEAAALGAAEQARELCRLKGDVATPAVIGRHLGGAAGASTLVTSPG